MKNKNYKLKKKSITSLAARKNDNVVINSGPNKGKRVGDLKSQLPDIEKRLQEISKIEKESEKKYESEYHQLNRRKNEIKDNLKDMNQALKNTKSKKLTSKITDKKVNIMDSNVVY